VISADVYMQTACIHRGAQVYDEEAGEVYCARCGMFLHAPDEDRD
jgi:hypothetical protein